MRRALDAAIVDAQRMVDRALAAPLARPKAFAALAAFDQTPYERGIVLYVNDTAYAWSGAIRVPTDDSKPGVELAQTPIYLELRVTRAAAGRRATAVVLLDAVPPGDSLSRPLNDFVATREELRSFDVTPAESTAAAPAGSQTMRYSVSGHPLVDVRYMSQSQESVSFAVRERARVVVSAILAFALFAFIVAVWRDTRALAPRLAILAVALACTAIVPAVRSLGLLRAARTVAHGERGRADGHQRAGVARPHRRDSHSST
jgi:hypothetical protein